MNENKLTQSLMRMAQITNGVFADASAGMTNRERELRQDVSDLKEKAQALMDEGKHKEARTKLDEAKAKKSELDNFIALQKDFQNITLPEVEGRGAQIPPTPETNETENYKGLFFKAIRGQSLTSDELDIMNDYKARMSSKEGEDGGYVIPEDIQTKINKLRRSEDDLRQYVRVVPVSTNKGSRTMERDAEHTPLQPLDEYDEMDEIDSPKFDRLNYVITDYAGFLPVPNSVLDDSDQNLEAYLIKWISQKSKATDNHLILEQINGLEKKTFSDYKGIKTTLNVTLDPSIAGSSSIYTNQDGFNYLDQIEDDNKRPLLQPDPTQKTKKLFAGTHPIVVLSNKTIKTSDNKAPFIIGDLEEAIVLWDRKQSSVDMTKVGGKAWRSNTTEFRTIVREDVTKWDEKAVVFGQIDIIGGGVEG